MEPARRPSQCAVAEDNAKRCTLNAFYMVDATDE
jgi:hypothetical protein